MDTVNRMTESVRHSKFNLPVYLFPIVAFGIYLLSDAIAGNLAIALCDKLQITGIAFNRIQLLSALLNILVVALWIRFLEARSIRALGFYPDRKKDLFKGSILGFVSFTLVLLGAVLCKQVTVLQAPDTKSLPSVLFMVPFWYIQAAGEEVLFRGWILSEMCARKNTFVGIVTSSVLFVFLHSSNTGLNTFAILNLFLFGVLLAILTLRTDSIWMAIGFHALWNFAQGSFFGMSVSGSSVLRPFLMNLSTSGTPLLSGGAFGLEASLFTTILNILLLTGLFIRKKKL